MTPEFGKYCVVCGRRMLLRRKWRHSWENVHYCSRICRDRRLNIEDLRLEAVMLELLHAYDASETICPSEAARIVAGSRTGDRWRALMPAARRAARRLAAKGRVEFLQKGRSVDASTARGPIRIRLRM